MDKYNEIMEHIHVNDEMRDRVISGVNKYFANEYKRRRLRRIYTLGAAAAVAVIVVSGVSLRQYGLNKEQDINFGSSDIDETEFAGAAGTFAVIDCKSRDELEGIVSFEVPELSRLPFEVRSTAYTAIGDMAQTIYYGETEDAELSFRKATGTDDISGDYNVYAENEELNIDGVAVNVNGNDGLVYLATWTDGEYSYSISISQGCSEEVLREILNEVIK